MLDVQFSLEPGQFFREMAMQKHAEAFSQGVNPERVLINLTVSPCTEEAALFRISHFQ